MAPGASIIAYRALGPGGGYTGDLVAAIGQAVLDGVDIINYSISGSVRPATTQPRWPSSAPYSAGITVNSSAGNSGPGASTADHASPWTTTVGASTFDRAFTSALVLTSSDGATYVKSGLDAHPGCDRSSGGARCERVPARRTRSAAPRFPAGSVTGKVVVCERGGTSTARLSVGFRRASMSCRAARSE